MLAGLAVALLVSPAPRRTLSRLDAQPAAEQSHRLGALLVVCGMAICWALFGWRVLGWAVVAAMMAGTLSHVLRHGARERRRLERARETARAGSTLALLLSSGRIPTEALVEASEDADCLAPAATSIRLGGNASDALRRAAAEPGREGLAAMAAAWHVSERSGAPVAEVMEQVAVALRQEQQVGDVVAAELSAARASGRIMALLPLVAIALGTAVGADPVSVLFNSAGGQWLVLAGVGLACAGVVWTERIASGGSRR